MAQAQMLLGLEQTYAQKLLQIAEEKTKCKIWTRNKYNDIVNLMTKEPSKEDKTPAYYFLLTKYEILQCGDIQKIIRKRSSSDDDIKYYACLEDMYNIVYKIHCNRACGRDKMIKEANRKYANVTTEAIELFKELCEECQLKKRKIASKGLVVKPIVSKEFNSRGQMDLVDMQSLSFDDFKYIMVYQDHMTKFVVLRPLKSKRTAEVAMQILDIFLLFGAPNILQSDNGAEFTASIISQLKDLWPEIKIVHGKPRHPQSQGSVERANADIKDMTITWMRDNGVKDWPVGIKFVQFQKNQSYHSSIKRTPYNAMFGVEAKVCLTTSSLPDEIISLLNTEDDLKDITNTGFRDNEEGMDINDINIPIDSDDITCIVCQKPASNAHSCSNCTSTVHVICGKANGEEGYGTSVLCFLCTNEQEIQTERTNATMCTEKQAEPMINRSNKVLEEADIGCNVLIPIPHVDRGKGDTKNIMAIVHQKTEKGYRLVTKHGILLGSYTKTQFEVADSLFLVPSDVCTENFISLRRALKSDSICEGQGFLKCGCCGKTDVKPTDVYVEKRDKSAIVGAIQI